jgi:NADH dehydrogenase
VDRGRFAVAHSEDAWRVATDRAGRACVSPSLSVPNTPGVFVVGDTATLMQDGKPVPGVAQVAIQQDRYVGRFISRELSGRKSPRPFRYFDKGNMAVVGKNFAIMESGRIRLAGLTAWFASAFIHQFFLPQLQNRLRVERQWMLSYFTGQRSSRLVTEAPRFGK